MGVLPKNLGKNFCRRPTRRSIRGLFSIQPQLAVLAVPVNGKASSQDEPCPGGDPDDGAAQVEKPEGRRHQDAGQHAGACAVTQDQGQGDQDAEGDDEGDWGGRQQATAGAGVTHPAAEAGEDRPAVSDGDQCGGEGCDPGVGRDAKVPRSGIPPHV